MSVKGCSDLFVVKLACRQGRITSEPSPRLAAVLTQIYYAQIYMSRGSLRSQDLGNTLPEVVQPWWPRMGLQQPLPELGERIVELIEYRANDFEHDDGERDGGRQQRQG
ncbi:hypothetical protein NL676_005944 [Syzygium grande]|nr:hypothetical protein NL676_005944 [Syzygium grande]